MNKLFSLEVCSIAAVLCLTGCLERQFAETDTAISVDRQELVIPSDSELGQNLLKDTVWVSANRSWSAEFVQDVDWVTMETPGHLDLARRTEKAPLVFCFKDNEGSERTAKVSIVSEAGTQELILRQQAISYRLAIGNVLEELQDFAYQGDTCKIIIKTNTDWAISIKEGSGVQATFSKTSGKYADEVDMYILENPDQEQKSGFIVLSSSNCPSVEVPMSQVKAKPYLRFPDGDNVNALDGIDNFRLPIKTNANWKASISSVNGFDKNTVSVTPSGDKTASFVDVAFSASIAFGTPAATITVKFEVEGVAEPVYATVSQVPCLRLCFGDPYTSALHTRSDVLYDKSNADDVERIHSYWPFATYTANGVSHDDGFAWVTKTAQDKNVVIECTLKHGGYVMHMFAGTKGCQYSPNYFSLGNEITNYLGCPIVPGHKLVKVDYWIRGNGLHVQVQNAAGAPVTGGDLQITGSSQPINKVANLDGTEAGAEYKIGYARTGYWFRISDITFYYE